MSATQHTDTRSGVSSQTPSISKVAGRTLARIPDRKFNPISRYIYDYHCRTDLPILGPRRDTDFSRYPVTSAF